MKNTLRKQEQERYGKNFNKSSRKYLKRKEQDKESLTYLREYLY